MFKKYIKNKMIKFIYGEINNWKELMKTTKEGYEREGRKFEGSDCETYYRHIIDAYSVLITRIVYTF